VTEGTRPKQSQEQRRDIIRRAAYACFRDHGYHETTVDAICATAGISKGSFYWHYTSKQAVFVDVLDTWSREIMGLLYDQFEDALEQQDYMAALTEAIHREIHRGRVIVPLWLEFTVHARRDKEIRDALAKFFARARSAVVEMLRPFGKQWLSDAELRVIAATIFGAYVGMIMQDVTDPDGADADVATGQVMTMLETLFREVERANPDQPAGQPPASAGAKFDDTTGEPRGLRVTEASLDAFLENVPEATGDRLRELRELVLRIAPDASERIIPGWRNISYGRPGLFCYLKPRGGAVTIGFHRGVALHDPAGLLSGSGKRMRHASVPAGDPYDRDALAALVRAAHVDR